jgi:hypothetical protein
MNCDILDDMPVKLICYIVLPLFLILFSCSARKKEKPAILQEKKIDVSSIYKKRGADLVEALYEELVSHSNELKELEKEIKAMKAAYPDSLEAFKTYHEKSVQYYESAEKKANSITDTALKNAVLRMIRKSQGNYRDTISTFTQFDSLVQKRAAAIDHLHQVIKLMSTLPVIEEFQVSNRPDTISSGDLISRMDKLIAKMDSLTRIVKGDSLRGK